MNVQAPGLKPQPRLLRKALHRTAVAVWGIWGMFAIAAVAASMPARAQTGLRPPTASHIVMASTTSTEQSGLFAHLLPAFKKASGIEVRVVALGTGQALDAGRRGDADVVLVHDQVAEEKFVTEGFGLKRVPVMYNDFILVGPKGDPAGIKGNDISQALRKLASSREGFISRGDSSGTHAAELRYWRAAGVETPTTQPMAYAQCGCGMGPALNIGASRNAHVLTDRGTWLNFKNRGDLAILVQGDQRMFNPYGIIVVNPIRHPHAKASLAQSFADWLVSPTGQAAIAAYRIGGEQLFFPNARP